MTGRPRALRARARALPPFAVDAAVATILVLGTFVEASFAGASWTERLTAGGPAAIVAVAVLVLRRAPTVAVAVGGAGLLASSLLVHPVENALNSIYFGWLFLVYSMAVRESGGRLVAGVVLAEVVVFALALTAEDADRVRSIAAGSVIFVAGPVFAGRMLASRLRLGKALEDKADRAEAARAGHAHEAALGERARIAGELHDVVAHALGAMTIQAAAARRLLAVDASRAAGAFGAIETTGRDALGELRTLLDALRGDEDPVPLHEPQPSLAALSNLVDRARDAGLPVELELHGSPPPDLAASVDLTAYRVVQEALREALQHGDAGKARVVVRYLEDCLEIEVADDGLRLIGRRLLGLRERVRLYGGQVEAGPRRDGGHVVEARLPLEGVPA